MSASGPSSSDEEMGDAPVLSSPDSSASDDRVQDKKQSNVEDGAEVDTRLAMGGVERWVIRDSPCGVRIRTEKKRGNDAAYEKWVAGNRSQLAQSKDKGRRVDQDDDMTVGFLLKDLRSRRIIDSPREYQMELFERAKRENSIAVLDTGLGKTLIGILLIRWTIEQELESRAAGQPRRLAVFLVDKVALVFQQHGVLAENLPYPVDKFCGATVEKMSKEDWRAVVANNDAIVMTAEVLHQCLAHAFVRMHEISLLIFDEAHHTKKNHPYARIIKDFYAGIEDQARKPRILGMTASPVDSDMDPKRAAAELEGLLHSRIVTRANGSVAACLPKEMTIEYAPLARPFQTRLCQALERLLGSHDQFRKVFAFAVKATSQLGPWLADRYWRYFFSEEAVLKTEESMHSSLLRDNAVDQLLDRRAEEMQEAKKMVDSHQFEAVSRTGTLLSSKVISLLDLLHNRFADAGRANRCIVFVQERSTARMLADLLQQPGIDTPGLRAGVLVGAGNRESGLAVSYREQLRTLHKFKRGELNCIVATSVAEEGLDIPDCNIIIRFDLYRTLIQYIQSRGRARQEQSEFIHMIESRNLEHARLVSSSKAKEDQLRRFCDALPEDRKLSGNDYNMDYFLRKEKGRKSYTVPSTGAKLSYQHSLVVLAAFTASLPHPPNLSQVADYVVVPTGAGFQCEVMMPAASPVASALGLEHSSKAVAKCSAAFCMCLELLNKGYLDDHLQSSLKKQLPAMRNARLAVSAKQKKHYQMRIKPAAWSDVGEPVELHAMALTLANPAALGRPSTPLLMLTRRPLAPVAPFPLFFDCDRWSLAGCKPVPGTLQVGCGSLLAQLVAFTLRIFRDVFSKHYEATAAELPYFLAPLQTQHDTVFSSATDVRALLDADALQLVERLDTVPYRFEDEPDDFFRHKFIWDPFDGSRKFFLRGLRRDLKPSSPMPDGIVAPRQQAPKDILNYSVSLWTGSRKTMRFRVQQPVVEAELLPLRRNLLDDAGASLANPPQPCYLVLEPLKISPLPAEAVAMAYTLPAILHRIEAILIAMDGCGRLGLGQIRPDLGLEAFTKDSDNTDEQDADHSTFKAGMGNNYERLEFLGDCFLKMATTIAFYTRSPDSDEFEGHVKRMLLICNQNLFNNALEAGLQAYIRSHSFDRRSWYPRGLKLTKGKKTSLAEPTHQLGDKTVADVCEALIGAAYLTTRPQKSMDLAVQAVTAMVRDDMHDMQAWSDYVACHKKPPWQTMVPRAAEKEVAERLGKRLRYSFRYPRLLRSAMMHPSYASRVLHQLPSYQRLEFLGDAVLDMACVDYLFHKYPGADPEWLTTHKIPMVSNDFLASLAVKLGLHRDMCCSTGVLMGQINRYVDALAHALESATQDALDAGKSSQDYARNYWQALTDAPKCLADLVEAYVGAIFVDSDFDFATVEAFFEQYMRPEFEDMHVYDNYTSDATTLLRAEIEQRMGCRGCSIHHSEEYLEDHELVHELVLAKKKIVAAVMVHRRPLASWVGKSARYSRINAAREALLQVQKMGLAQFRAEFGCTCLASDQAT